jgi:hypothetical protein
MGRGVAKQALERVDHNLDRRLGKLLKQYGNRIFQVAPRVLTFPVKPDIGFYKGTNVVPHMRGKFKDSEIVPGWAMLAHVDIIKVSMIELDELHGRGFVGPVWMPKPGCGAGGLRWADVKPAIDWVGDWLTICDLKP